MKRLKELVRGIPCSIEGNKDTEITGIAYHSAKAKRGFLFVAIDGFRVSGVDYIEDAVNRGAVAVATDDVRNVNKNWVATVVTESPRRFLAQVANRFNGFPSRKLKLVGITGTNGKTTTSYLMREMARAEGQEPGFCGTIEYFDGKETTKAKQTTPESLDFVEMLGRMNENGCETCIAEVSSHALALDRVFDMDFKVAVFTNLSQDHLDFHRSMRSYKEAKLKLFTGLGPTSRAIVNLDDAVGHEISRNTRAQQKTYGTRNDLSEKPDVFGKVVKVRPDGLDCELTNGRVLPVSLKLVGSHNLMNLMAAFTAGLALDWDPDRMKRGAEALAAVPGRLERIGPPGPYNVYVDYAHTPEALARVLSTAKEFCEGRVICVFGAGGDRDKEKRPLMGRAVSDRAAIAFVTSDNPRNESPRAIIDQVAAGMNNGCEKRIEPDRRAAIEQALDAAGPGDVVIVAGKGHEDYQIVGNERRDFDDRKVVGELLEARV